MSVRVPVDPLTTEQQKLVTNNLGLAQSCAGKFYKNKTIRRLFTFEEIYSAASLGLCKAARRYDGTRGAKFSTYAYFRMLGEIQDFCRVAGQWDRGSRDAIWFLPLITTDDGEILEDLAGTATAYDDFAEDLTRREQYTALAEAVSRMSIADQQILELRFSNNLTCREMSEVLGISKSWASRELSRILDRLKRLVLVGAS